MLVASPEAALTAYDPTTRIIFRSAVPEGLAVIPFSRSAEGERVAATTAPAAVVSAPAAVVAPQTAAVTYTAPMLGVGTFKKGDETKIKVDFTGPLAGARANVFLEPKSGGPTKVEMKFHDLKQAPAGKRFVVWAVGANGEYVKIGEITNLGTKNEAEIKSEVALADFGLLLTMEETIGASPLGPGVAHIHIVP
jgi:hypothetical protein